MLDHIKNPFVVIFPSFVAGILISISYGVSIPYPKLLLFLILILLFVFHKRKYLLLFGFGIYFFGFVSGLVIADSSNKQIADNQDIVSERAYIGYISAPVVEKNKSIQAIVQTEAERDSLVWQKSSIKLNIYFEKDSNSLQLKYGDRLFMKAQMKPVTNLGNPCEFDYRGYLQNKGIYKTAYLKSNKALYLGDNNGKWYFVFALKLRSKLLNVYKQYGFEGEDFAVLSALTLGYKDKIERETRQIFANTGAMHILAVSGLHVGIIYLILTTLLKFMDKKRWLQLLRAGIIIISLWIFAAIAGLSPSVSRSALMFSLFVVGRILKKTTSTQNIIFASAVILLCINPLNIKSVGFQLSYSAVLAIVIFQPRIYKIFQFRRAVFDKIWALTSVSIAAQIGTMPIGLYIFHQFPNYFFLTNILVIPMASIILYLAVALLVVAHILPFLAGFTAFLLKISVKILLYGVKAINMIPFATTHNIHITPTQTIIMYISILAFTLFWIYNNKILLYVFFSSIIMFLSINLSDNYKIHKNTKIILFNNEKSVILNVLKGEENYVCTDTSEVHNFDYSAKPYWISQNSKPANTTDIKQVTDSSFQNDYIFYKHQFFCVGNTKSIIINNRKLFENKTNKKIRVNFIFLTNNVYLDISELTKLFDFDKVIFAGNNKAWRTDKWSDQCRELNIKFFNVKENGAFGANFMSSEQIYFD